jgi:hypothetical protein
MHSKVHVRSSREPDPTMGPAYPTTPATLGGGKRRVEASPPALRSAEAAVRSRGSPAATEQRRRAGGPSDAAPLRSRGFDRAPRVDRGHRLSPLRSRDARVTKPEKRPRAPQHRRCRDSRERESRPGSLAAIFRTRLMATAKVIIFALPGFRISPGTFGGACAKPGRADARVPQRSRKRRTLTT